METMAATVSLAKNVIFNLCKAFPNASPCSSLWCSTKSSRVSFATCASKNPWEGCEEMKEKAKEYAEESSNRAAEMAQNIGEKAKQTVQGAWEAAKDTTQKIKETVMGSNGDEKEKEIEDEEKREGLGRKAGTKPTDD